MTDIRIITARVLSYQGERPRDYPKKQMFSDLQRLVAHCQKTEEHNRLLIRRCSKLEVNLRRFAMPAEIVGDYQQ